MSEKQGYRKLKIWEKAHRLAVEVFIIDKAFPKEMLYGLISQLHRAAFSVSLNIVEGHASTSRKEFLSYLNIATRSLGETEYMIEIVRELNFIQEEEHRHLETLRGEVAIMLTAFTNNLGAKG